MSAKDQPCVVKGVPRRGRSKEPVLYSYIWSGRASGIFSGAVLLYHDLVICTDEEGRSAKTGGRANTNHSDLGNIFPTGHYSDMY